MRRPKITRRRILFLVVAWLLVIAGSLTITALRVRWANLKELSAQFPEWKTPGRGSRVIVFAPHCDDESVGAGGLIRQAAAGGAQVWVVLVTNGDGFWYAAFRNRRALVVRPRYYVDFGYRRQKESFAALRELGVARGHVITLGYPDRGLLAMWTTNWHAPYTSPYTRDPRSPYDDSFTPRAVYTGEQFLSDLKKLLRKVDPTDIYIPHPNDQHSDHWATSAFVTEALYDLGWLERRNVGLYLVHRGDWPVPQGLHPDDPLAPPAKLVGMDTSWYDYPLDADCVRAKKAAVAMFRSQVGVVRFLRSFVRRNELFGARPCEARVASASIRLDGRCGDWRGVEPIARDPADDGLVTHSRPGADLVGLYAAEDRDRLYLRVRVRGTVTRTPTYEIQLHPLGRSEGTTVLAVRRGSPPPAGWSAAFGSRDIELSCPIDRWKGTPLLVAAAARISWYSVDRTAYRLIVP